MDSQFDPALNLSDGRLQNSLPRGALPPRVVVSLDVTHPACEAGSSSQPVTRVCP